ncbi:hypothetical protein [Streptomyces canus]|uniref:hypothetical protein n=1 Tax=Streptomyces canus TaxID=58343 RepID=UPI0037F5E976
MTLGPLIASAFTACDVVLDVFTLTSEVLYTHVRAWEELIRAREIAPATITIRMLVPSDDLLLPFPYALDDRATTGRRSVFGASGSTTRPISSVAFRNWTGTSTA